MYAFNSHMQQNTKYPDLKWTIEDLLSCCCYVIKTNCRTIRSQVVQPASAGGGANMSELRAHHCMTPEQWTWLLCSVSVVPANKLSLQESNQSELSCWLHDLQKILVLSPKFHGVENARFDPLRTPVVFTYHEFKTAWVQCKTTPIIVILFAFTCSTTMLTSKLVTQIIENLSKFCVRE